MPTHRKPRAAAPAATNGRDILDASADGQTLHGLRGNDLLRSTFDRTSLFGDGGNDRLMTTLSLTERTGLLARQFGGTGNDVLNASVRANYDGFGDDVTSEIVQDGGAGADRTTAHSYVASVGGTARATNTVNGRAGDDILDVKAEIEFDSAPDASYATNVVFGGGGDDQIKAEATGDFSGADSYSTNRIDGGAGDDTIEAMARVRSNGGFHALNDIEGGSGNDTIVARASSNSNDSSEIAENIIAGGDGNDRIEVHTNGSFGSVLLRAAVEGGSGDDTIVAESGTGDPFVARAILRFDGGLGNDRIESTVVGNAVGGLTRLSNRVEGYDGNDRLVARLETPAPSEENPHVQVAAFNRLDGGSGNDQMIGSVHGLGRSIFNGGSGADLLRVEGGQGNLLSGGSGLDRLFAGSGTDRFFGGGGADDFVLDVREDQGADSILDFEGDRDRLCFVGLADEGAAGLADDLDAITTVIDHGASRDVVVTFDSGTVLTFEGCGLGSDFLVDSLAELVENARTQLVVEPL
jgi:Ca2+-binding RTX toxin-like protein